MNTAREIIETLRLSAHPEGGWYRETWRADNDGSVRARTSAILFLLDAGERSHWHRIDAAEIWLWHAGSPLLLTTAATDDDEPVDTRLGPDVMARETPQFVVPAHHWQSACADAGWALVSCIVSPGFEFAGFALAPDDWAPGAERRGG